MGMGMPPGGGMGEPPNGAHFPDTMDHDEIGFLSSDFQNIHLKSANLKSLI